jgi:hypothetical protein
MDRVHVWTPSGVCTSAPLATRQCARCHHGRHHPVHAAYLIAPTHRGPRIDWTRIFRRTY